MLDISDRAYKTYELGKREPSLETVLKFCRLYSTDLQWIATGAYNASYLGPNNDNSIPKALAIDVATAVYEVASQSRQDLPPKSFNRLFAYVLDQVSEYQKSPHDEAEKVFNIFHDDQGAQQ